MSSRLVGVCEPNGRKLTFAISLMLLLALAGCSAGEDGLLAEEAPSEAQGLGVTAVARKENGTVSVTFVGVAGADSYRLVERKAAAASFWLRLLNLNSDETAIKTFQHVPGRFQYLHETSHIPFGAQFCYRTEIMNKGSAEYVDLGDERCLERDDAWGFAGVTKVTADEVGRIVVSWNPLPVSGVVYEVYRKEGSSGITDFAAPASTATDKGSFVEEMVNQVFPRCYVVRATHSLLSQPDTNGKEVCIESEQYLSDRNRTSDNDGPQFSGIKDILILFPEGRPQPGQTLRDVQINAVLTWEPAVDNTTRSQAIRYWVYRADNSYSFDLSTPYAQTGPGQLSYTDKAIDGTTIFYYLVRAVDERGNQDQNFRPKELPLDFNAPAFGGLAHVSLARESDKVVAVLVWEQAQDDKSLPGNIRYHVYRSTRPQMDYTTPAAVVTGQTTYRDRTIAVDTLYYYQVRAYDEGGNVDSNNVVMQLSTLANPPVFGGLETVRFSGRAAALSWRPALDNDTAINDIRYRVYRYLSGGQAAFGTPLAETKAGDLTFEDHTLDPNVDNVYVVRAVDNLGYEDQNTVARTLAANRPPVMERQVRVDFDKTLKAPVLSWYAAEDDYTLAENIRYRVFRSDSSNLNSFDFTKPITATEAGVRTFSDQAADPQRSYSYVVRAEDGAGAISVNTNVVVLLPNQPPVMGQIQSINYVAEPRQVVIRWTLATDDRTASAEIKYHIYRFPAPTVEEPNPQRLYSTATRVGVVGGNETTFSDFNRSWTSNYTYVVRAVDEFGLESVNSTEYALGDNLPPVFQGVMNLGRVGNRYATVSWALGSDDRTPRSLLTYSIFLRAATDEEAAGITQTQIIDPASAVIGDLFQSENKVSDVQGEVTAQQVLLPDTSRSYFFGVRARDEMGLTDSNRTVWILPGNAAPTFGGVRSALLQSDGSGLLSWLASYDDLDSANQISYRVYKLESGADVVDAASVVQQGGLYRTTTPGQTSLVDLEIDATVFSHYVVRAVDTFGNEERNEVVKFLPRDSTAPYFTGIKNGNMQGNSIILQWDLASDNRSHTMDIVYKIYEGVVEDVEVPDDPASLAALTPIITVSGGQSELRRALPTTNHTYVYLVRACDVAGNCDANQRTVRSVDEMPPQFQGLLAGYAVSSTSVQLFWTGLPNDDIELIKIYSAGILVDPIASIQPRSGDGAWESSIIISGLTAATSYSFVARAEDHVGNEDTNNNTIAVTTHSSVGPTFAGASSAIPLDGVPGLTNVLVSWSGAADATHYRIFRVRGASARGEEFEFNYDICASNWNNVVVAGCTEIAGVDTTSYQVSGLAQNTRYSFVVRAVKKNSDGTISGVETNRRIVSATTLSDETPPTFVGLKSAEPSPGSAGLNSVNLTWDAPTADGVYDSFLLVYADFASLPPEEETFVVPADPSTDPGLSTVAVSNADQRAVTVGGLITNNRYCFTIVARYSAKGIQTTPQAAGFKCATPTASTPIFSGVKSEYTPGEGGLAFTQFTVHWEQAQGSFSSYEVSVSTVDDYVDADNPGSFFAMSNTEAITERTSTSHTFTGLEANKNYYVRARARFTLSSPYIDLHSGSEAKVMAVTRPKRPAGDGVVSVFQEGLGQVRVRWNAPNNGGLFNKYFVFRGSGEEAYNGALQAATPDLTRPANEPPYAGTPYRVVTDTSGDSYTDRNILDTAVVGNTSYCYLVKAAYQTELGFLDSSNTFVQCVDVRVDPPLFDGIASVSTPTTDAGFATLILRWQKAVGNFTRYQYAVSTSAGGIPSWRDISSDVDVVQVNITEASPGTGLTAGTDYYVLVRAVFEQNSVVYSAGGDRVLVGRTTPKVPAHAGIDKLIPLETLGEYTLTWTAPDANPEIGGLYNNYLIWQWEEGTAEDIFAEVAALMADGRISQAEIDNPTYHVTKIASGAVSKAVTLTANKDTCFLVRAAYLNEGSGYFTMSENTRVVCATPTANAPLFLGVTRVENIPDSTTGFVALKVVWEKAAGTVSGYQVSISNQAGVPTWSSFVYAHERQASAEDPAEMSATLTKMDYEDPTSDTALQAHQTYYVRVRAFFQSGALLLYSGGGAELSRTVRPDLPVGDGISTIRYVKEPGSRALAEMVLAGNGGGFWNSILVFSSSSTTKSTAANAAAAKAVANDQVTGPAGAPQIIIPKIEGTHGSELTYTMSGAALASVKYLDTNIEVGKWTCYVVRNAYYQAPHFLLSQTAQTPQCVFPTYEVIQFSGLAPLGSAVCDSNPSDGCNANAASARWPYTGNSRVMLKFSANPLGDIDYFDIYRGKTPDADAMLAAGVWQSVVKGDTAHDPDPGDDWIFVGGGTRSEMVKGSYHFLVRSRCLSCPFVDENRSISNAVAVREPWITAMYPMKPVSLVKGHLGANSFGPGYIEDPTATGFFSSGWADLTSSGRYGSMTRPGQFAPRPGTTIGMRFTVETNSAYQNLDGSALFAIDTTGRTAYQHSSFTKNKLIETSRMGDIDLAAQYDPQSQKCLYMGGRNGSHYHRDHAGYTNFPITTRMQEWDGVHLSSLYLYGREPTPIENRLFPVTTVNPLNNFVTIMGGAYGADYHTGKRTDTWEWDGYGWRRVHGGVTASQWDWNQYGRYMNQSLAWDQVSNRIIALGGSFHRGDVAEWDFYRHNRRTKVWAFDPTDPSSGWQAVYNTPSNFPDHGNETALIAGKDKFGQPVLYYADVSRNSNCIRSYNLWYWDGFQMNEIPSSALPVKDTNCWNRKLMLYGFWDSARNKLVMSLGVDGNAREKQIYEYTPATNAWIVLEPESAPLARTGNQACYDETRKILVDRGGTRVNSTYGETRSNRRFDEIWEWNGASWDNKTPFTEEFDNIRMMATFPTRGLTYMIDNTQHQWFLEDGLWKRVPVVRADLTAKSPTIRMYNMQNRRRDYTNYNPQVMYPDPDDDNKEVMFALGRSDQASTGVNGRGLLSSVHRFDGTTWEAVNIVSNIELPPRYCNSEDATVSNNINYLRSWESLPHFEGGVDHMSWSAVQTDWGILVKPPRIRAYIPYANPWRPDDPLNCDANLAWRYVAYPRISFVVPANPAETMLNAASFAVKEVVSLGDYESLPDERRSSALAICQKDIEAGYIHDYSAMNSTFQYHNWHMTWDPVGQQVVAWGIFDWHNLSTHIFDHVYTFKVDPAGIPAGCVDIKRVNFDSGSNTEVMRLPAGAGVFHEHYYHYSTSHVYDPDRNTVLMLGTHYWGRQRNIFELDLSNFRWTKRTIPDKYVINTVFNRNHDRSIQRVPGKQYQYYVQAQREVRTGREVNETWLLIWTPNGQGGGEYSVRPATVPPFGVTVKDNNGSLEAWISVPGDDGTEDSQRAGTYLGKRRLAADISGSHTLFVRFNADNTYSVFLDDFDDGGAALANVPWDPTQGLFIQQFILGARYGSMFQADSDAETNFRGLGDSQVSFDWVGSWKKALTSDEMSFWNAWDDDYVPAAE